MEANSRTNRIPAKASECPTLQHLDAFVRPLIAEKWYNLGLQLLAAEDVEMIKANHPIDASKACTAMFSLWLQKYPTSSWNSLISAIKGPGIEKHDVATKIELMLQPATTATKDLSSPHVDINHNFAELFCQSKSVGAAYASLISALDSILKNAELSTLKLAIGSQHFVPGIDIGKKLSRAINLAKTSSDILQALQQSSCCNWLDTRLLEALACGANKYPYAYELIKAYETFLHSKKLDEVLSCFPKSKVRKPYAVKVGAKIDIDPNEVTVGMLFRHRDDLENVILNLGKGRVRIKDVKKGCLEVVYSIPADQSFQAYKNALQNRHKFQTIRLLYLTSDTHTVIYDPWLFDLALESGKGKEVFHESKAARYLCEILLENVPVDDIITIFSSHDLLKGNDLTVVNNAPSDYLKKVYLMRLFENIGLSVWSTICAVVNGSEILNHLGDQLIQAFRQSSSDSTQLEEVVMTTDDTDEEDELLLTSEALPDARIVNMVSQDDNITVSLPRFSLHRRKRSLSFDHDHLYCLKYLNPLAVETVFQYTVNHVIELLSGCDPILLVKWCENMMASTSHGIKLFPSNFIASIKQLKSSTAVLKMLRVHWSWSNYSILIVLAQFSKLALEMLEEFGMKLNTALPITNYPISSLAVSMFPYNTTCYTVLTFECDQKLNQSLQMVYDMQLMIVENCEITQHALLLLAMSSNPTMLFWMIPKNVVSIVNMRVIQCSELFYSKGVTKIFIYPSTVHVLHSTKTVWPYMFLNEHEQDTSKLRVPPTDQLQLLRHVCKQRDAYRAKAEHNSQIADQFRIGYEKEEQKCKEINKERIKEAQIIAKLKEKLNSCKEDIEVIIKAVIGDSDIPNVATSVENVAKVDNVQNLEHDMEYLEKLINQLLPKSVEQSKQNKEYLRISKQLKQQLVQKKSEIEDQESNIAAKDHKIIEMEKKHRELVMMNSDLKQQKQHLSMDLSGAKQQLADCQRHLNVLVANTEVKEAEFQMSTEEEKVILGRLDKEDTQRLNSKLEHLKRILQAKDTILTQMERDNKSLIDTIETMEELINDSVAQTEYVEQLFTEKATVKQQMKDMELQPELLRNEGTTKEVLVEKLKQEIQTHKAEIIFAKQLNKHVEKNLTKHSTSIPKCDSCGRRQGIRIYSHKAYSCLKGNENHLFCNRCHDQYWCPVHSCGYQRT